MTLDELNALPAAAAREDLLRCCGCARWADAMLARRPFRGPAEIFSAAREEWRKLGRAEFLEAFSHHPTIGTGAPSAALGGDVESLRKKFAQTADWAAGEQGGAIGAPDEVLRGLADGNREYEERFGHIFIVCATGKSAEEMLALLRARLPNTPDAELRIAAGEQEKITALRLEKLLT